MSDVFFFFFFLGGGGGEVKANTSSFISPTNSQGRSGLPCEFDADLW